MNPDWIKVKEDTDAWAENPLHRIVYDRLFVAGTQDYASGPCGIDPPSYPIIVKPITNLFGMGIGATREEAPFEYRPGYMWSEILSGRHVSTDALVAEGKIIWSAQAIGFPSPTFGRFEMWSLLPAPIEPELGRVSAWIARNLADYSGPFNAETIGGQMIEAHLRLSMDWQRASCYGDYASSPIAAIGVPIYGRPPDEDEAPHAHICRAPEADRRAFVIGRLQ